MPQTETQHFFQQIIEQQQRQLPFVVYRKPGDKRLCVVLQKDTNVYEWDAENEEGFVFAPFSKVDKTVLFPYAQSDQLQVAIQRSEQLEVVRSFEDTDSITETIHIQHLDLIKKGINQIEAGVFEKVVLSRKEEVPLENVDTLSLFKKLECSYSKAFVYLWYHPQIGTWLGATPETLTKLKGDVLHTVALAGTRLYDPNSKEDWGAKEQEEQQLVTDYIVQNLEGCTKEISVTESYSYQAGSLEHLKTDVTAILKPNVTLAKILETLHPTPAVCGMPKNESQKFIIDHEQYNRAYYTGYLGAINKIDCSEVFVNLRCMELVDNKAIIYVGGGITKDSDPESEWKETVRKTTTIKKVLA